MSASNISEAHIRPLAPVLVDRIAAGEVVDGPYSVVKELVENGLDALADSIEVDTAGGGMDRIVVTDNGLGIRYEELPLSLQRHATSKIEELEDIDRILSFGFRGEALAAIASVSHMDVSSTRRGAASGGTIESRGGQVIRHQVAPPVEGTSVTVTDLFYAVPARRKFARSERVENGRIYRELLKVAFGRHDVSLRYTRGGKEILNLRAGMDLRARVAAVYRADVGERLIAVSGVSGPFRLRGFVGNEQCFRSNREGIFTYVNGRAVELPNAAFLVRRAFGELLPSGSYPYAFFYIEADPTEVDVNVHPAKKEVRFRDGGALNSLILHAAFEALRPGEPVRFENYRSSARQDREPLSGHDVHGDRGTLLGLSVPAGGGPETLPMGDISPTQASVFEMPQPDAGSRGSAGQSEAHSTGPSNVAFVPLRHFGVILGTYILAEGEDGFYIIDQHTAHERVNYERMRGMLEDLRQQRQALLHPLVVECLPDELALVLEEQAHLAECGFIVEEFGPAAYVVREVPGYVDPGDEAGVLQHVIERLSQGETAVRVYDEFAAMKACKASIKKNDVVLGEAITDILTQLARCENPARCPHGRPTMMKLSQAELDRMFHRS